MPFDNLVAQLRSEVRPLLLSNAIRQPASHFFLAGT